MSSTELAASPKREIVFSIKDAPKLRQFMDSDTEDVTQPFAPGEVHEEKGKGFYVLDPFRPSFCRKRQYRGFKWSGRRP